LHGNLRLRIHNGRLPRQQLPHNAPFTDKSDKGDLRLDFQQSEKTSWFLKIDDRKETAVNYPTLPEPIDGQANGEIKILDRQVALGYNHTISANKIIDARFALSGTKAGKWTKAIGTSFISATDIPGLPTIPNVTGGLPSMIHLRRLYLLWAPEHQPAMAEPLGPGPQGQLHLGQGQALPQVRL
jgi:hypothetical protein